MPYWAWALVALFVVVLLFMLALCRVAADADDRAGYPRG